MRAVAAAAALTLLPPDACRLPNRSPRGDVALGFPRIANRMNSTGARRLSTLFLDFSDVPAGAAAATAFFAELSSVPAFFAETSYGALNATLAPLLPATLRMPAPSTAYSFRDFVSQRAYLAEAGALAAAAGWNFSGSDAVVVMAPPAARALPFGPAFCAAPGAGYEAGGVAFENSATSGADFAAWRPLGRWANHELAHTLGLVDLYDFAPPAGASAFRFTGEWSIMGDINGAGNGYFGWERWLLAWLPDAAVACAGAGGDVALAPLGAPSGTRLVVVPTGATTAVCVEYRVAAGVDARIPKPGLLVYAIDTALATGAGPLRVLPVDDADATKLRATLAPGEAVSFGGVTVTCVASDAAGAVARVAMAGGAGGG